MSTISEASVPTTQGLKYLQQLCKHWAHNLAVILDETSGRVIFPANARGAALFDELVRRTFAAVDDLDSGSLLGF